MSRTCRRALLLLTVVGAISAIFAPGAGAAEDGPAEPLGRYVVVFKDSVEHPGNIANAQVKQHDGRMKIFFSTSFDGYAATLPKAEVNQLRRDPSVAYVERDQEFFPTGIPTGLRRIFGVANKELSIDGINNRNADVDVAVIDTGVDFENTDLNVAGRVDCVFNGKSCIENSGVDTYGHGTYVASIIGARDNNIGPVGVAPGARLWSVRALNDGGAFWGSSLTRSTDWVTSHASTIEVANMSLNTEEEPKEMESLKTAIDKSIEAGVVYVVAAGNKNIDASTAYPSGFPNVITVSSMSDYDGLPGAKLFPNCQPGAGADDSKATISSWGAVVDIAAPGVCIEAWGPGGGVAKFTGTSAATPHVAGAAALLASRWGKNPNNKADVEAIRNTLVEKGNYEWTDTSPDGIKEPLLDVSNEATFSLLEPPQNTALPVVSPEPPSVGTAVFTTVGTWTNSPTNYAYQWQRCNAAGAECVDISGATTSTYTATEADGKKTLVSKVTATNSGGQGSAVSKATKAVLTPPTTVTGAPVITKLTATTYRAELRGTVNPNGIAATSYVEWGPTTAYGSKSPEVGIGSGSSPVIVGHSVFSLPEGSIYHYRVVGKSADGTSYGADRKFKAEIVPTAWSLQTTPNPSALINKLNDVSCLAGGECFSVGSFSSPTVTTAQRWNGTEWKTMSTASLPGTGHSLESISCTSTTACTAVGYQTVAGSIVGLAERWDGTAWKTQELPGGVSVLRGVSCASATECMAVGSSTALGARWDGLKWTAVSQGSYLEDVSCVSASFCAGVGGTGNSLLTRVWNGSNWTEKKAPNGLWLSGVSCTASNACTAVGAKESSSGYASLAVRWNGTEWSTQEAPDPLPGGVSRLEGVSCSSATVCVATGRMDELGTLAGATLVERWNGDWWEIRSSPNPAGAKSSYLTDVSCISSLICQSVGQANTKSVLTTLAERSS
jgi:subtilisin family serine protease